jgi:hypothetical protein
MQHAAGAIQQGLMPAGIELSLAMAARFRGDFGYVPLDPLLNQKLDSVAPLVVAKSGEAPPSQEHRDEQVLPTSATMYIREKSVGAQRDDLAAE